MTDNRVDRYRQLFTQIGEQAARPLLDRLQVLALTQPETVHEFEALIERGLRTQRSPAFVNPDRRRTPDRRRVCVAPAEERRRSVRRASDRSAQWPRDAVPRASE